MTTLKTETLWRQVTKASPVDGYGRRVDTSLDLNSWSDEWQRRDHFRRLYSFAVPTPEAIAAIVKFVGERRLLEAGAGSGLWARLLADAGVDVTAVDNHAWSKSDVPHGKFYAVAQADAVEEAAGDYGALMLCWPDYATSMAADCLKRFRGDRVVYIGEGSGGCTGDDCFHEQLRKWHEEEEVVIPQWPGLYDYLVLYRRKERR